MLARFASKAHLQANARRFGTDARFTQCASAPPSVGLNKDNTPLRGCGSDNRWTVFCKLTRGAGRFGMTKSLIPWVNARCQKTAQNRTFW